MLVITLTSFDVFSFILTQTQGLYLLGFLSSLVEIYDRVNLSPQVEATAFFFVLFFNSLTHFSPWLSIIFSFIHMECSISEIFFAIPLFPLRVHSPTKPASYSVKWTIEEKELFEQGLVNRAIFNL